MNYSTVEKCAADCCGEQKAWPAAAAAAGGKQYFFFFNPADGGGYADGKGLKNLYSDDSRRGTVVTVCTPLCASARSLPVLLKYTREGGRVSSGVINYGEAG